jgi:uncharacterized membrane protein YsdA (DUF1294 family)
MKSQIKAAAMDRWTDKPLADLLMTLAIVGGHLGVVLLWGHGDVLAWPSTEGRIATYAAGAGVMSLIAGFTGTAIAQYGSSSGPIIDVLRKTFGPKIRRNWINITKWLLGSAVLCIVAMSLDRKNGTFGSQWIFEFALAVAIFKFARLLFLFGLILDITDKQSADSKTKRIPQLRNPPPIPTPREGSWGDRD